jgi:hypothetical protein
MLKSILLASLFLSMPLNFAYANSIESAVIEGVKFLGDIPEVEWYRVDGRTLVIGWKGIPRQFPHTNRKAARRAAIATEKEIYVWAVRHNQKKWTVGSGKSYICSVLAKNGRVKTDTCPYSQNDISSLD